MPIQTPKQTKKRKPHKRIIDGKEISQSAGENAFIKATGKGSVAGKFRPGDATAETTKGDTVRTRDFKKIKTITEDGKTTTRNPARGSAEERGIPEFTPTQQTITPQIKEEEKQGAFGQIGSFGKDVLESKQKSELTGIGIGTIAGATAIGGALGGPVGAIVGFGAGTGLIGGIIGAKSMATWLVSDNIVTGLSLEARNVMDFVAQGGDPIQAKGMIENIESNLNYSESFIIQETETSPLLWGERGKAYLMNLEVTRRNVSLIKSLI